MWLSDKESTSQCRRHRRQGLIPGSGRSPGGGNGNPVQYSCLEHSMDRGGWPAKLHEVTKIWTWSNDWEHTYIHHTESTPVHCNSICNLAKLMNIRITSIIQISGGYGLFKFFFSWLRGMASRSSVLSPGMEPRPPTLEAQSLNHWTTRKVPRGQGFLSVSLLMYLKHLKNAWHTTGSQWIFVECQN